LPLLYEPENHRHCRILAIVISGATTHLRSSAQHKHPPARHLSPRLYQGPSLDERTLEKELALKSCAYNILTCLSHHPRPDVLPCHAHPTNRHLYKHLETGAQPSVSFHSTLGDVIVARTLLWPVPSNLAPLPWSSVDVTVTTCRLYIKSSAGKRQVHNS
jgi:hypothetical protein